MSRKLFVLVSVLLAVSLLLAACAKATPTAAPATEAPATEAATQAPVATEDPMVTLENAAKAEGTLVSYG